MNELKFDIIPQAGVISADFESLKLQLSEKMKQYKTKEFTEENKKEAKADVADLRKLIKSIKERDTEVKKIYMAPYTNIHSQVGEIISLIEEPIQYIDGQIKLFEEKRINEKQQEIKKAYQELVPEELTDYIPLECIYGGKWNNAGTTIKSIRKEMDQIVEKTQSEIAVLSSMQSDKVQTALNIYMENRDLSKAVKYINDYESRKAEILRQQEADRAARLEREKQAEIERIRREERQRIAEEERLRQEVRKEAVEEIKAVDEVEAATLSTQDSIKVVYTVVATEDELREVEMAFTSLGVYFERKDV